MSEAIRPLSVVTGASSGIGYELARLCAQDGFDLIIAADGVHSLVREQLLGPEKPHFTGKVAYRTIFDASRMKTGHVPQHRTKWWGKDRHMVIYPVTANRSEIYFVTSQPEQAEWRTAESWSAQGDLDELKAGFAGFHAEVQAVLNAAASVHKWALFERDPDRKSTRLNSSHRT